MAAGFWVAAVYAVLKDGGDRTISEMVEGLGLSRPTALRLLKRLEAQGLVGR